MRNVSCVSDSTLAYISVMSRVGMRGSSDSDIHEWERTPNHTSSRARSLSLHGQLVNARLRRKNYLSWNASIGARSSGPEAKEETPRNAAATDANISFM